MNDEPRQFDPFTAPTALAELQKEVVRQNSKLQELSAQVHDLMRWRLSVQEMWEEESQH